MKLNKWQRYAKNLLRPRLSVEKASEKTAYRFNIGKELVLKFLRDQYGSNEQFEVITTPEKQISSRMVPLPETKNTQSLLKAHGYDDSWILVKSIAKSWDAYSKKDGVIPLVSSTIEVKPRNCISPSDIEDVYHNLKPAKLENFIYEKNKNKKILLELMLPDLHFGKLSWDKESGQDYDIDIAIKKFQYVINEVIDRAKHYPIEKIIYIVGNDFLNIDNDKQTTNKGTPQDCDGRWQKIYSVGCEAVIWAVDKLRAIAPVLVEYVPGNHDHTWSYFVTKNTQSWFHDCENVEVEVAPTVRKYHQYGVNLIGWTHGQEKPKNLDKVMQAEVPELWGNTTFRELHAGHKHIEEVISHQGFIFRRIPTYIPPDSWHIGEGYVGQTLRTQVFLWEKETGLYDIMQINVDNLE